MTKNASASEESPRPFMGSEIMLPSTRITNVDTDNDGKIDGFQFDVRNPFYTAEPVSSIRNILVTIDKEKIDPSKLNLVIRGQIINIKEARTLHEIWWGYGEVASVYVQKSGGLKKGSHEVECTVQMRPSAGDYGFGDPKFSKKNNMFLE